MTKSGDARERSRSSATASIAGGDPAPVMPALGRAESILKGVHSPYERPMTSSMISSVPAPMRFSRRSRQARSMPYSFM